MNLKDFFKPDIKKIFAAIVVFSIAFVLIIPLYVTGLHSPSMVEYIMGYTAFPSLLFGNILQNVYNPGFIHENSLISIVSFFLLSILSLTFSILYWYSWGCIFVYYFDKLIDRKKSLQEKHD